jgi:hypothetical protein
VDGWAIVQEGERPPDCPECEGAVDREGRTLIGISLEGLATLTVLEELGHEGEVVLEGA